MHRPRQLILASGFLFRTSKSLYRAFIKNITYYKSIEDIIPSKRMFVVIPFDDKPIISIEIKSLRKISLKAKKQVIKLINITPSKEDYIRILKTAKNHIKNGDIYQINLSLRFEMEKTALRDTFLDFYNFQPTDYGFFFEDENIGIASGSMELFLSKKSKHLLSKPIKGTSSKRYNLAKSQKDKSENLMITDVMRNDLNALELNAFVDKLFNISKYKTLFHMYSSIHAKSQKPVFEILKTILPVASVTGAPKKMAYNLIKSLEPFDRTYYCGVACYISKNKAVCSVLIRTFVSYDNKLYYFAGAGITWDSIEEKEYEECILKSRYLFNKLK